MFRSRVFNIALLLSLAFHLSCIFGVNIVVLPGRYSMRDLTSVSFLGPILDKTALEIILANKPVGVTTTYQRDLSAYVQAAGRKERVPAQDEAKQHIDTRAEDSIDKVLGRIFRREKEIPGIVTSRTAEEPFFKGSGEISGTVADREIMYKPARPELPTWTDVKPPFTLELEFVVSAQGEVKEVVPFISSGNPEIDLMGIRYLKSWRFAPLTKHLNREEEGRIKFIFDRE